MLRHRLRGPTRIARARSPLRYLGQLVCRGRSCRARPTSNRHPAQQWLCSLHRSGLAAHTAVDMWCEMHRSRAHHASIAHQYTHVTSRLWFTNSNVQSAVASLCMHHLGAPWPLSGPWSMRWVTFCLCPVGRGRVLIPQLLHITIDVAFVEGSRPWLACGVHHSDSTRIRNRAQ